MTKEEAKDYIREWCPYDRQEEIIKALEQEPCEDCISRQAVLNMQYRIDDSATLSTSDVVNVDDIEDLPPVTPQPKMGHWINQHVIYTNATIDFKVCSECRYEFSYDAETGVSDANYCPNCGAKMEGK